MTAMAPASDEDVIVGCGSFFLDAGKSLADLTAPEEVESFQPDLYKGAVLTPGDFAWKGRAVWLPVMFGPTRGLPPQGRPHAHDGRRWDAGVPQGLPSKPVKYVPWTTSLLLLSCGRSYIDWVGGGFRFDDPELWRQALAELRRHSAAGDLVWKSPSQSWTPELMLEELTSGEVNYIETAYYMCRDRTLAEGTTLSLPPMGPLLTATPTCAFISKRTKYIEECGRFLRHLLKPEIQRTAHGRAAWILNSSGGPCARMASPAWPRK